MDQDRAPTPPAPSRGSGSTSRSSPRRRAQVISHAERRVKAVAAIASAVQEPGGLAALSAMQELNLLIDELRAADDELRQQNAELETALHCAQAEHVRAYELFEFAPIALIRTDAAGVIREANRNAERIVGCGRERMLEMPLVMFIHRTGKKGFREQLRRILAKKGPHTWETMLGWQEREAAESGPESIFGFAAVQTVVVFTAEAERNRGQDGRPLPIEGIRWAIQDIDELVIGHGPNEP
jgi:PAS domain S-box-containing protein